MRHMLTPSKVKKEAFRAGYAPTAAEKIFNVIGRRLGVKITMGATSDDYSNSKGKFSGYLGGFGDRMIRVNFALGKSDKVVSVDYWKSPSSRNPDYCIDLNGFNVVQVIDTVVDVITGDYFDDMDLITESKVIREQAPFTRLMKMQPKTNKEMLAYWLTWSDNEEWYEGLHQRGKTNFDALYKAYAKDALKHLIKPPKTISSFRVLVSTTLKWMREESAAEQVPVASVTKGTPEDYVETTPDEADEFAELMASAHLQKFETLRLFCEKMAEGDPDYTGVYVYGQGGIGKSYLAKQILLPLSNTYYTKGSVAGYTGLLQMLYDHKDGEILVLDDIVSKQDMKNSTVENVLKAVLDSDPPRHVKVEKRLTKRDLEVADDPDLQDLEPDESMYDFVFNSSIMFITNYEQVPQALEDRCWTLEMNFTNSQVADIINNSMDSWITNVPKEDKQFVLDFIRKHSRKKLSFRLTKRCINFYIVNKDNDKVWKTRILNEIGYA